MSSIVTEAQKKIVCTVKEMVKSTGRLVILTGLDLHFPAGKKGDASNPKVKQCVFETSDLRCY